MSENMTPEEKELVSLMEASGETPDALLYRLRFAPPEQLDTLYNGTLHILRLSGKAVRVYAIHTEDSAAAMEWVYSGRGQAFTKRRDAIRKMIPADRGRAVHVLAGDMEKAARRARVRFSPRRVDWFTIALCIVYGKRPAEAVALAPDFLTRGA